MVWKKGDKFRSGYKNYIVYSWYGASNNFVINLDTGESSTFTFNGTEEKIVGTYIVDNSVLLSDVKVGDKFKYYDSLYVKIDPIQVNEAGNDLYTAKCIDKTYGGIIGRGFCIPLDKMVERVKD